MFTRILAAIDEEGHADHAVRAAADLAVRYRCPLLLLTVLADVGLADDLESFAHDEGLYVGEVTQRVLDEAEAGARRAGVADIERLDMDGPPVETILRAAESHHADLIVMGSRRIEAGADLIHGSVSHQVMARAPCPCLIAR